MNVHGQVTLRARKLGVLLRDARMARRRSIDELAKAIDISSYVLTSYEEGRKAPSLPDLEVLAFELDVPVQHFLGENILSDASSRSASINLGRLATIRQRIIGATLRQKRMQASITLKDLSLETGFEQEDLKDYEEGARPIPLPELEVILSVLGSPMEAFLDQNGPIGDWMNEQSVMQEFLKMPPELRVFISRPVNRPYLELAKHLSELSAEKLRSVAESLLDITL